MCSSYDYTTSLNCSPAHDLDDGYVEVSSRAFNYNPFFYFVVGTAAKAFDGDTALYVMRITAGLLSALFVGAAGWVTSLYARSRWTLAAMLVAMTPVMIFSMSIVAPNGLEMAAALCLWMSLLGLGTPLGRERHTQALLLAGTISAVVLATLRELGPVWVLLIMLTVLLLIGVQTARAVVVQHPALSAASLLGVSVAAAASVMWTRAASVGQLPPFAVGRTDIPTSTTEQIPLWFLQGIAAFPRRSDAAPLVVYVVGGLLLGTFLVAGTIAGTTRLRLLILGALVVSTAGPIAFTALTIRYTGPIWQGRYGLPFHMGVTLLAGFALDGALLRRSRRLANAIMGIAGAALASIHVIAMVHVRSTEQRLSPLRHSPDWITAPTWVIGGLVIAGWAAWLLAARGMTDEAGTLSRARNG